MYKTIIIDDEETVRRGLRSHFDWEFYGLTVVEEFPDCAKAYAYVKDHPVDLAVTDVRTPEMDGITFAKKLQEEFPSIQVVFISGYADVELLKGALKTDAFDYILKSVDLNELAVTVRRVVDLLDKRNSEKNRVETMEKQLKELQPLMRDRLLRALLYNEGDLASASYLGVDLDADARYLCMVIHLTNKWDVTRNMLTAERLRLGIACEQLCALAIEGRMGCLSFKNKMSEFIILLKCSDGDYEEDVLDVSSRIQQSFMSRLGLDVSIGISEPTGILSFKDAYDDAREAIERHYYLKESSSIAARKYKKAKEFQSVRENTKKLLTNAILSGDSGQVSEAISQAFTQLRSLPAGDQDDFELFLLNIPADLMADLNAEDRGPYSNQRRLMESWLGCEGRSGEERFIRSVITETASLFRTLNEPGSHSLIRLVQSIIAREYMNQLSVTTLADQVHLTPTYLCVLFKQTTGKTLNEYLTDERIRHAKELLKNPSVRLYDICYQVGYLSPSYFSKLFKKQTGMTPREYREKVLS